MEWIATISQIAVALVIVNVWVLRLMKPSPWRAGDAASMRDEFEVYGLPEWSMPVVGGLKLLGALLLLIGLWVPTLARITAVGLAVLMAGAVAMHVNVRGDPPERLLPAAGVLVLCLIIIFGA